MNSFSLNSFSLETLIDFPDDALRAPFPLTEKHLDAMMAKLAEAGVLRVGWATYGDGHGGFILPRGLGDRSHAAAYDNWEDYAQSLENLKNPLRVATQAAHRHGMEIYGYFKPYETGAGLVLPAGSPEAKAWGLLDHPGGRLAWIDPFVIEHPHLRIKRRSGDILMHEKRGPIHAIKLIKKDATPTRIAKEHLQIWSSEDNYRYRPLDVCFQFSQTIETAPRDVYDLNDNLVTRRGDQTRVLTLSGLELCDAYLLITTNFADGPADFENICTQMMVALNAVGREIPDVFANGSAIWCADRVDFRSWGLVFDHGWGKVPMKLDTPNAAGKDGLIAFHRGRSEYLSGQMGIGLNCVVV